MKYVILASAIAALIFSVVGMAVAIREFLILVREISREQP